MDWISYFGATGEKLKQDLVLARASLGHRGNKGSKTEQAFRNFLRMHIPRIYEVGHGEVTDKQGNHAGSLVGAGQIDAFIISQLHPRFVQPEEAGLYIIEGVLAACEIKSSLKTSDMKEILIKAAAFKRLKAGLGVGDMVHSNDADISRFVDRRPYFLFAFESKASLNSIYRKMLECEADLGLQSTDHLDAIFILDCGSIINLGDGNGALMSAKADGSRNIGWISENRPVMIALIAWLSAVIPQIVHLSPITTGYFLRTARQIAEE